MGAFDSYGCVPLHYVANSNYVSVCKLLLQRGADINLRHRGLNLRKDWTPLHFAAYSGSRDIVLLHLLNRAAVNQMDGCRRTPLYYARNRDKLSSCRIIEKFGGL